MLDWGSAPQWVTALIAGGALFAAYKSIQSQREIARKRAATDFFLKTEMDKDALASHTRFVDASNYLKDLVRDGRPFEEFTKTAHYYCTQIKEGRPWSGLLISTSFRD